MEELSFCPVCNSQSFSLYMNCQDHFLTGETFNIMECTNCGFRFTNPRPEYKELGRYYQSTAYISHSNTRKGLFNWIYQKVRKYTLAQKYRMISSLSAGSSILDIGCATGEFLAYMKKKSWITTGIEPDENARKMAVDNHQLHVFPESHINTLEEDSFDVITLWHVLEHVSDLKGRMQDLQRLLKPGGIILIAVPNSDSFDATHYKSNWAAYDVPRHLYHFTKESIEKLLKNYGFKLSKIFPMKFDAYYVSILSEKYGKNKLRWILGFWNGLCSNWRAKSKNNYSSLIFVVEKT